MTKKDNGSIAAYPCANEDIASIVVSKQKESATERALFEYSWQVGQSRLQSKMLSFPQPSFSAGLGEDLFHSVTVQNGPVLESRAVVNKNFLNV